MTKRRRTYRRRRGRFAFFLRPLCFVLVLAALIGAMTAFFKAEHIEISGSERYSEEQILEASGIRTGDNLFLMNKFAVTRTILRKLPYVETASIRRRLPDTLLIEVSECEAAVQLQAEEGGYLVSAQGKILEQSSRVPEGCVRASGAVLAEPEISAQAAFSEKESYKCEALFRLLRAAEEKRILEHIRSVDLSDGEYLQLVYLNRFTVKLPWDADMAYKLESLASVTDCLEENETGTINLMTDGKASFIPK